MGSFIIDRKVILAFAALLILSLFFALSRMPGGIGGTGITGAPGGIGGTGIYGRIDAFGSIWVNGVEIFYDEDQNVSRQGRDGLPERLAIGQFVAVTFDEESGRSVARTIEIIEEVNGVVEIVSPTEMIILGQKVILDDKTIIDMPDGSLKSDIQVAVNGLRNEDGFIIASRIAPPLIPDEISLRGTIDRVDQDDYWIEDQKILQKDHGLEIGEFVEVSGRLDRGNVGGATIVVENVKTRGVLPFDKVPLKIIKSIIVAPMENERIIPDNTEVQIQNNEVILEAQRTVERETRRIAETEIRRQAELEARRAAEQEVRRQAAIETRRAAEQEARRQAEIEVRHTAERDARRQADIEVRRQTEIEARRQAEIEARRQAEIETRRQAGMDARRQAEIVARRQAAIEARRQAEIESQQNLKADALNDAQGEVRDGVRLEARRLIRERLREEARRKARLDLRRPPN